VYLGLWAWPFVSKLRRLSELKDPGTYDPGPKLAIDNDPPTR